MEAVDDNEWKSFLRQGRGNGGGGVVDDQVFAEIASQVTVEGDGENAFIPSRAELTTVMARVFGKRKSVGNIADQVKDLLIAWIDGKAKAYVPSPSEAQFAWLRWMLLSQRMVPCILIERKIRGRGLDVSITEDERERLKMLVDRLVAAEATVGKVSSYGEELRQRNEMVEAQQDALMNKMAAYKHLQRQMPLNFADVVDEDQVIAALVKQAREAPGGDPTAAREIKRARDRQQQREGDKDTIKNRKKLAKLGKAVEDDPYLGSFERVGTDPGAVVNRLFNADLHQRMYGEERRAFEQGRRQNAFSIKPVEESKLFNRVQSEAGDHAGKPSSFGKNAIYLF